MKLNYSRKILILSVLVFVGVLVLDVIFTNLLTGKIASINDKVKQLTLSSQERERNLLIQDSIANSEKDRVKIEKYFVGATDADTATFISGLEALAHSQGLVSNIQSVSYEPVGELTNSSVVVFTRFKFNVAGKWNNVYSFLQTIENLPKVLLVRAVSFDILDKGWSANIDFSVVKLKK